MNYFIRVFFTIVSIVSINSSAWSQVYSNMELGKGNAAFIDSIKHSDYPYVLPIWGKKATKLGFNLPYSAGLGVNYLYQKSDLVIENLQIGFNHGPLYNLNEVIRFNNATSEASGINIRPDIWLFPFLNIYGILAKSSPSTTVDFGIFVPDETGQYTQVAQFNTQANFNATTFGFGLTPTIGIGGGWLALDMNFTWSDIDKLDKPAFAFIFDPRLGKTFKLKRPESNIAIWAGAFRLMLNTGTEGSLNLNDLINTDGLQAKVDAGVQKVSDKQIEVDNWWNSLSGIEQNNPLNKAKHDLATRTLSTAGSFLGTLDNALNDDKNATVQYSLDKRQKNLWNFLIGSQYQYNNHWMLRCEVGLLGSRTQVIAGLQYRFGL
jgi:hypothetical protein